MMDIQNVADIELIVLEFYKKVKIDPLIGHFFTEVKQLSFEEHIPVIVTFWESILFDSYKYKGNPMIKHLELNKISELSSSHFQRWLSIWNETVKSNFNGPLANKAISQAESMAAMMQFKIKTLGNI